MSAFLSKDDATDFQCSGTDPLVSLRREMIYNWKSYTEAWLLLPSNTIIVESSKFSLTPALLPGRHIPVNNSARQPTSVSRARKNLPQHMGMETIIIRKSMTETAHTHPLSARFSAAGTVPPHLRSPPEFWPLPPSLWAPWGNAAPWASSQILPHGCCRFFGSWCKNRYSSCPPWWLSIAW